ncbi:MAG: M48 family metalloprotease, partial [Pirellulaceae bacterium]|nr:M48 family metalloprotease [Pirellulaceae bacterium]
MHLLLIVAIATTLLLAESGPAVPVAEPGARLLAALLAVAASPLFAAAVSSFYSRRLRSGALDSRRALSWCRRLRRAHVVIWLAFGAGVTRGLDWSRIVRFNWRLDGVPLVEDILLLLPVWLPLILSWAAFYRLDRALSGCPAAGKQGSDGPTFASLASYVGLHVRHYLGVLLIPILCLLAVQDVVAWWRPGEMRAEVVLVAMVLAMLLLLVFFPVLLRRAWRTQPLADGSLRTRLEIMARGSGAPLGEILVWKTDSMVVNAAVTGLNPWLRYVFLSDGLLGLLDEDEIAAVFAHELGHVRNGHVWLRAAAMFWPLGVAAAVAIAFPHAIEHAASYVEKGGLDAMTALGLAGLAAIVIYVLTFFAFYSRSLEHEA